MTGISRLAFMILSVTHLLIEERGENMTKEEFDSVTRDLLVAWFIEMYEYISGGEQAQKIEPLQKRQLIATAQSLLHDIQDALDSELKGSDK